MGETVRLKTAFSKYFSYGFIAMALATSIYIALGDLRELTASVPFLLAAALAVWAVFAQPHVEISDGGITVVNVISNFHIPWPTFEEASTEWNLQIRAGGQTVTAWALPIASGSARRLRRASREPSTTAGIAAGANAQGAALLIGERFAALSEAGHLGEVTLAKVSVTKEYNLRAIIALGAGLTLVVLGLS